MKRESYRHKKLPYIYIDRLVLCIWPGNNCHTNFLTSSIFSFTDDNVCTDEVCIEDVHEEEIEYQSDNYMYSTNEHDEEKQVPTPKKQKKLTILEEFGPVHMLKVMQENQNQQRNSPLNWKVLKPSLYQLQTLTQVFNSTQTLKNMRTVLPIHNHP